LPFKCNLQRYNVGLLAGPILLGYLADETSIGTALVANGAVLAGAVVGL
jgi:hypothetical protein